MTTAPTANFNGEHRSSDAAKAHDQKAKAKALAMLSNFYKQNDIAYLMIKHVDDPNFLGSDKLCGYFDRDHFPEMVDLAFNYSGCCESIFIAINKLKQDALCKCANHIGPVYSEITLCDADIVRRTKLLIDVDPKRAIGGVCCATNQEQQKAKRVAEEIRIFLDEAKIPVAMTCFSGNGYHLYISIDLATESDLPKRFLRILASKFNTEAVEVDLQVSSACQLTRFYGTRVCKGQDLPDRPHRDSFVIDAVTNSETIGSNALEQFVDRHETPLTSAISPGQLNLDITAKIKRARSYVAKMESAISGDGGHNRTFTVACKLILGFDLSVTEAFPIFCDYNQRCRPSWTEEELRP